MYKTFLKMCANFVSFIFKCSYYFESFGEFHPELFIYSHNFYMVRLNPSASPPPYARLAIGCQVVPTKLQRQFLALEIVLDQVKFLLST